MAEFTTLGAIVGLVIAIVLIIKKVQPAYSLILGALIGGLIGGGKAGNILSPNPNTIAASEAFGIDLTALMMENAIPAVGTLVVTIVLATMLSKKGKDVILAAEDIKEKANLPGFMAAFAGPLVVIILLALRPIFGISIDPLIALPVGGLICVLVTGNAKRTIEITEFGLSKVIGVSILLIGTGTIAGIIKASALQYDVITIIEAMNMPAFVLAPISGVLMAAASASTTAGTTIASQTFGATLIAQGVPALSAGAMVHAGATVLDSLPHGSFFHATGGAVRMSISDRMKLIPYEAMIGLTSTILAVIWYLI